MVGILMVGSLRDHNLTAETSLADEVSAAKIGVVRAKRTKTKRENLIVEVWIERGWVVISVVDEQRGESKIC